jgi:hypothetical protein
MNIADQVKSEISQVISEELGVENKNLQLSDSLDALGVDSLVFAILVARLEAKLGFDPFVILTEPKYPNSIEEFIEVYEGVGRDSGV